jgi:hypothetical protein
MKQVKRNISENVNFDTEYNVHPSFGDEDFMEVRMPISKWKDKDGDMMKSKMSEMGYSLYDVGQCDGGAAVVVTFKKKHVMDNLDESRLRNMVRENLKKILKEMSGDDEYGEPMCYGDVARLLSENGWSIFHDSEVTDKDYRNGIRFNIEPDSKDSLPFEELKQKLIELCDEYNSKGQIEPGMGQYEVSFSSGYHKYAPENKFISIVIWNLD